MWCGSEKLRSELCKSEWVYYNPDTVYTYIFEGDCYIDRDAMVLEFDEEGHFWCYMLYSTRDKLEIIMEGTYEFSKEQIRFYKKGEYVISFDYEYKNGYLDMKWAFESIEL